MVCKQRTDNRRGRPGAGVHPAILGGRVPIASETDDTKAKSLDSNQRAALARLRQFLCQIRYRTLLSPAAAQESGKPSISIALAFSLALMQSGLEKEEKGRNFV